MATILVGRDSAREKLKSWLTDPLTNRLRVISIEGATGVGKTTLIESVLNGVDLEACGFLLLRIDGGDADSGPINALATMVERGVDQLPPAKEPYFGCTKALRAANDQMMVSAQKVVDRRLKEFPDHVKNVIHVLIHSGAVLRNFTPGKYKEYLPDLKTEDIERIEKAIEEWRGAFERTSSLVSVMKDRLSRRRIHQDRLVRDSWKTMADYFFTDVNAILTDWKKSAPKDFLKLLPPKVVGKDHLCLFIDDYERFQNDLGRYCVAANLLAKLRRAKFHTVLIVSGRDDLSGTDPNWDKNVDQELREHTIVLEPLRLEDIRELLDARGTKGSLDEMAREIYEETEGYPLLVDSALRERATGGRSAISVKKFYERLTMGMTLLQRTWLERISFLDRVSLDTISRVLPDVKPDVVLEWFQSEGSIRDVTATEWAVRPFVRSRIQMYVKLRSPSEHERLLQVASV